MATMNAPTIDRRQLIDRRSEVLERSSATTALDYIAMALMIVGGLNWAMVGLFQVDVVATLFGAGSPLARLIYVLVGVAALWGIYVVSKLATHKGRP
jgi:uncharacterized membrane protein YuzA (DUF378 family)